VDLLRCLVDPRVAGGAAGVAEVLWVQGGDGWIITLFEAQRDAAMPRV
jgi:hypothetical protein